MVFDQLCSRLRVKSIKKNVIFFPSSFKNHESNKRSILGHRTSGNRILYFLVFFSVFIVFYLLLYFSFYFNSFFFNVIVLKCRL